jgi:hypothetical protein
MEVALERFIYRQPWLQPAYELSCLGLIRLGERFRGSGKDELQTQLGGRGEPAAAHQTRSSHDTSQMCNNGRWVRAVWLRGASLGCANFVPMSDRGEQECKNCEPPGAQELRPRPVGDTRTGVARAVAQVPLPVGPPTTLQLPLLSPPGAAPSRPSLPLRPGPPKTPRSCTT